MIENDVMAEIRELQKIELEILLAVSDFCQNNKIEFFLGEGTLLGAVRHHGFIPWDDDVDILMKRSDYNRFLELAPEGLKGQYIVQHSSLTPEYWSPFAKVRRYGETSGYSQGHISHLTSDNGPLIDIFPIDYIDNTALNFYRGKYFRFWRAVLFAKLKLKKAEDWKRKLAAITARIFSSDFIHRRMENSLAACSKSSSDFIAMFSTYQKAAKQIIPAEWMSKQIWVDFEGHKLPIPNNYHQILTQIYGDYMTPPDSDNRLIKHHFGKESEEV